MRQSLQSVSSICFRNQHSQGSRTLHKAFPADPKLRKLGPQEQQEVLSSGDPVLLPHGDQQLLHFYVWQCQSHHSTLQAALVALMFSTGANQPPGLFMTLGKQMKAVAQHLLFIGNTLGQLTASAPPQAQVRAAGTVLGQALRATVLTVKGAALGYPSSSAAQADGAVWDTAGTADPAVHLSGPLRVTWPCCAPPLPAGALFQSLGSQRALCQQLGEVLIFPHSCLFSYLSLSQGHLFCLPQLFV